MPGFKFRHGVSNLRYPHGHPILIQKNLHFLERVERRESSDLKMNFVWQYISSDTIYFQTEWK